MPQGSCFSGPHHSTMSSKTAHKQKSALLEELRQQISGEVVSFGEKMYDKQRTPWLQVIDQHPLAIVNAANIEDISRCVRFATREGLPLAVQNTGHGIARACNGGILLRLSGMDTVKVDPDTQTAIVGPGASSGELLAEAERYGLAYASGQVSNVGVIGHTLGGGFGWIGRKAGAACHAVRAATVVLADGSVATTSESEHPDLFWAIRGGGGNFGVIASITIALVPLGKVFGGMVYYRMKDAPDVLRFYREWTTGLGPDTSTTLRLMKLPPKPRFLLHGLTETCALTICHADADSAETLHRRIVGFKDPVLDDLKVRSLSEMATFDEASNMDGSPTFSHVECLRELTDEVLENVLRAARERIPPIMQFELQHLGGRYTQREASMAFTAPTAQFWLHLVSPAIDTTLPELEIATKEAFGALGPVYTGEAPYNFLRGDQQARVPDAFDKAKYQRLRELKRQYDPQNVFHLNLNISPASD